MDKIIPLRQQILRLELEVPIEIIQTIADVFGDGTYPVDLIHDDETVKLLRAMGSVYRRVSPNDYQPIDGYTDPFDEIRGLLEQHSAIHLVNS